MRSEFPGSVGLRPAAGAAVGALFIVFPSLRQGTEGGQLRSPIKIPDDPTRALPSLPTCAGSPNCVPTQKAYHRSRSVQAVGGPVSAFSRPGAESGVVARFPAPSRWGTLSVA